MEEYNINNSNINGSVKSLTLSKDTGTVKSFALSKISSLGRTSPLVATWGLTVARHRALDTSILSP